MISIIVYFVLVILMLIDRKSKFLRYLSLIYSFILFAFNSGNADYDNYIRSFELASIREGFTEEGFRLMNQTLGNFGFQPQSQYVLVGALLLISLNILMKRLSPANINFVLALFMLAVFPLTVVQLRSTAGLVFVLIGFYYLFTISNKYLSFIVFAGFSVLASFFHVSCIFFLFFGLVKFASLRRTIFFAILIGLLASAVQYVLSVFLPGFYLIEIVTEKAENYSDNTLNVFGKLVVVLYNIIDFVLIFSAYTVAEKYLYKLDSAGENSSLQVNTLNITITDMVSYGKNMAILTLGLIPLSLIAGDFHRLVRGILIIHLCFFANLLRYKPIKSKIMFIMILACAITFYRCNIRSTFLEEVFLPVLTNNSIF